MSGDQNIGMTLTLKKAYEGQFKSLNNVCIFDNFVDIICIFKFYLSPASLSAIL